MRNEIKQQRLTDKLNSELGPEILAYLSDPNIIEIMLNPDGSVWLDTLDRGLQQANDTVDSSRAHQLLGSIAELSGKIINPSKPILETTLPYTAFRFAGLIPPNVKAPCFAIRKQSREVLDLEDYIVQGSIKYREYDLLRKLIRERKTVLIAGGPGTGKTTFANAILKEMLFLRHSGERYVLIEDTPELQMSAANTVALQTSDYANHDDLLSASLRLRPDIICVGECRGKEMLTLLKAWNTGTRGGITTIHANTAQSALLRVMDLAQESGSKISPNLVCESIQLVVAMGFDEKSKRKIKEIKLLRGYEDGQYIFEDII